MLVLFLGVFLIVGLLLRPYFVNLNRMVASRIKESDLINGEEAELPARRYRSSLLFEAIVHQQEFRAAIVERFDEFKHRYEKGKRFAIALAILVPVLFDSFYDPYWRRKSCYPDRLVSVACISNSICTGC